MIGVTHIHAVSRRWTSHQKGRRWRKWWCGDGRTTSGPRRHSALLPVPPAGTRSTPHPPQPSTCRGMHRPTPSSHSWAERGRSTRCGRTRAFTRRTRRRPLTPRQVRSRRRSRPRAGRAFGHRKALAERSCTFFPSVSLPLRHPLLFTRLRFLAGWRWRRLCLSRLGVGYRGTR